MPNGTEKKIVMQKWESLSKLKADFTSIRVCGGLRKSPYTVKIFGSSGVGKSTFADLTMAAVLKAIGAPATSEYIVTLDEKDKYMSSYKSYITGIKLDDYGNSKADFWETAPSDWIIKICNNIRQAAIMADLANKGKITIEPRCLTITTNVKHLHAGVTSYNPMSILRRAHCHVTLRVRPEFMTDNMLDSDKVIDKFGTLSTINDIWLIDIDKPVGDGEGKQFLSSWEVLKSNMNIHEYLDYIISESLSHNDKQTQLVDAFQEPADLINICNDCNHLADCCTCVMEPQFGERIATTIMQKVSQSKISVRKMKLNVETHIEDYTVKALLTGYTRFCESPYSSWTSWIPESLMDDEYVLSTILYFGEDYIGQTMRTYLHRFLVFILCMSYLCSFVSWHLSVFVALLLGLYFFVCYASVVEAKKTAYLEEIHERRGVLSELFISARDKHVQYACGTFASLALIYGVAQVVKALRSSLSMQGSLNPISVTDVQERDAEISPWKVQPKDTVTSTSGCASLAQMGDRLSKSLGQIFIGEQFCGAWAVQSNVLLIPFHMLPPTVSEATFVLGKRKIKFVLNPDYAVQVANADLAVVYVPNTGPLKDTISYFMQTNIRQPTVVSIQGLTKDATPFEARALWQLVSGVSNGTHEFNGAYYDISGMVTFAGMCMSPIIAGVHNNGILGFHIGGITNTNKGCGVAVLAGDLTFAINVLSQRSKSFILGPQASDVEDIVAGKKIAVSTQISKHCPSQFISKDAAVSVYGSVTGRCSYKSRVMSTPISDAVTEICGVPNEWGSPRYTDPIVREDGHVSSQSWKPWYASLSVCSEPSIGFDPALVDIASKDYLFELKDCFDSHKVLWKDQLLPLTDIEIVSGIDGRRFVDSMNMSTSMGFPIRGPKEPYIIDLEPTFDQTCPRTFTPEIWALVDEFYIKARQGICPNQIFAASLKDEPTKLSKEKVRVFQAAPIVLQICIRKYYLPVARFLSMYPLISECAVGINSHGPEWNELSRHMAHFGDDRCIAGDYAKYDLRMPAQLTIAAFGVMIDIARWSGNYSIDDLQVMKIIAHEVCTPLVAFNGTLIRFMGTNPSGQNMTVYLNSIVNSLLHRLAFNNVYPTQELAIIGTELKLGRDAHFRDLCKISTYGDDAKGSVRKGYDRFNHITMAHFLAANDIVFTMPDKTSAPVEFMSRFDADFLKRKDRFDPELGVIVGALDEMSIFKSLHSILRSKAVTPLDVCASNIQGAMFEWFHHGPEIYEKRRQQMKQVAASVDLILPGLEITHAERVTAWKDRYVPQSGLLPQPVKKVHQKIETTLSVKCTSPKPTNALLESCPTNGLRKIVTNLLSLPVKELRKPSSSPNPIHNRARKFILEYRQEIGADAFNRLQQSFYAGPGFAEELLVNEAKAILGKPTFEEYAIVDPTIGQGDLVYICCGVVLVVEVKCTRGRDPYYLEYVKFQATKYGNVWHILMPHATVYSIIYTEKGFAMVDIHGSPKFPARFAEFLDNIKIL
jgi:hypothetical protein